MNEVVIFALTIAAIGIAGIYGIVNGCKYEKQKLFSKENTDSVRGLVICMIMASHMAQSIHGGGYTKEHSFLMGSNWCFRIFSAFGIWELFICKKRSRCKVVM